MQITDIMRQCWQHLTKAGLTAEEFAIATNKGWTVN